MSGMTIADIEIMGAALNGLIVKVDYLKHNLAEVAALLDRVSSFSTEGVIPPKAAAKARKARTANVKSGRGRK